MLSNKFKMRFGCLGDMSKPYKTSAHIIRAFPLTVIFAYFSSSCWWRLHDRLWWWWCYWWWRCMPTCQTHQQDQFSGLFYCRLVPTPWWSWSWVESWKEGTSDAWREGYLFSYVKSQGISTSLNTIVLIWEFLIGLCHLNITFRKISVQFGQCKMIFGQGKVRGFYFSR